MLVYFVSFPGERHEDHIPLAIFTDGILMAKRVLQYVMDASGNDEENIKFLPESDEVAHVYCGEELYCTIRKVPANIMCPPVLST